jgi:hypothetical protein
MSVPFKKGAVSQSDIDPSTLRAPGRPSNNVVPFTVAPRGNSQFLAALWGSPDSFHQIATMDQETKFKRIPVKDADEAIQLAIEHSSAGLNSYFACAEYLTSDNRKAANVSGARVFWMDVDCGDKKHSDGKGYLTVEDAKSDIKRFCNDTGIPEPTHIVNSGTGLHVYWILDDKLEREQWRFYAEKLKALTKATGFLADDSRTSDIASVLRIPGTMNYKYDPPRHVELMYASDKFIETQLMLDAIDSAYCSPSKSNSTSAVVTNNNFEHGPLDLTRLKSALAVLDPDCDEATWKLRRIAPLARAADEHSDMAVEIKDLAKDWSSGVLDGKPSKAWSTPGNSNGLTGEVAFEQEWQRFSSNDYSGTPATLGTIYHDAAKAGCNDPLARLQKQFSLINLGGRVWMFDNLKLLAKNNPNPKFVLSNRSDGSLLLQRAIKAEFPDIDALKTSKDFFLHPKTICYQGVEFAPNATSDGYLNLWEGPTVKVKQGKWEMIREFLLNVICDGDKTAFDYLLGLLAHALQRPEEKPGVMTILIGGQGIGKGTFARMLQAVWSTTYLQVTNIDTVTGNFNASLEQKFIVFMDEALFSGDRRASDALKSLVTEPLIHINEKHQPARQMNSFHRFFASTNADHFKNTECDDRRDFVLRVSESHKNDHEYWKRLNLEIGNGGIGAMAYDLLSMDLSNFNVRAKPSTKALIEQKLYSLSHIARWWYDSLDSGCLEHDSWPSFMSTEIIINAVCESAGGKMYRKPNATDVIKQLKKLCPSTHPKQQQEKNSRHRGLALPSLDQARVEFEEYIGGKLSWAVYEG